MRSIATREFARNDQGMTGRTAAAVEQRVDDLLDRMILAEKTGLLSLQTMIMVGSADLAELELDIRRVRSTYPEITSNTPKTISRRYRWRRGSNHALQQRNHHRFAARRAGG